MSSNTFYKNRTQVQPVLNVVIGKRVTVATIPPPNPTIVRQGVGATVVMPNAASVSGSGNAISTVTAGGVIASPNLVFNNVSLTSTLSVGQNINNIVIGRLNYIPSSPGTSPVAGNIGGSLRYRTTGGIIKDYPGFTSFALVVPGALGGKADIKINTASVVPADYGTMWDCSFTINVPASAFTSFNYSADTPGGYPLPANITVRYNTGAMTTVDEVILLTTDGQLLKSFPEATDPVAAYGGTFTIIAQTTPGGGGDSPASVPGWIYEFKNPFSFISLAAISDGQTGGDNSYPNSLVSFQSNETVLAASKNILSVLKYAINKANAAGIKDAADIPINDITYIAGAFEKYFEKIFNPENVVTTNGGEYNVELWKSLTAENMVIDFLTNLQSQIDFDPEMFVPNPPLKDLLDFTDKVAKFHRWDLFGAPGQYFIPDETGVDPEDMSPYWPGFASLVNDDVAPALYVLELDTIK